MCKRYPVLSSKVLSLFLLFTSFVCGSDSKANGAGYYLLAYTAAYSQKESKTISLVCEFKNQSSRLVKIFASSMDIETLDRNEADLPISQNKIDEGYIQLQIKSPRYPATSQAMSPIAIKSMSGGKPFALVQNSVKSGDSLLVKFEVAKNIISSQPNCQARYLLISGKDIAAASEWFEISVKN